MVKLLSTVLSFLLIFGSVVPSLAQVQQQNARKTERLKSHIYSTATKAQADQTQAVVSPTLKKIEIQRATSDANFVRVTREEAGVLERANQVLENLRSAAETESEDNGPLTWPEFEAIYRPQLEQGGTLAEMLKGRSEEEAKLIREKYEEALNAMVHEAYVKYQQNYAQWLKEKEKEYKEELKQLSNEAVGVTNFIMYGYRDGVQGNPAKRSVDPISVFLPTMYTAFGKDVVTDQTRKKAVEVLRARIQKSMDGVGSQSLLQNTHALAVLGMDLRDAQLVSEVLIKHANEAGVAPAFIQVLGADLAGMKDIAPDYQPLAAVLLNLQSKEGNRSVWEVTPLKISNWVKGIHGLVGGVEFATKDYINSIYKDPEAMCGEGEHKRPCANSRSAWLDLGTELGEIAREDEAMRAMLNRVVNELVMVRAGEKEPQIMTSNNLFLTGLLGTGFKVSLKGNGVRDILTQQGTVVTLASEEQEVAKAVEEIKALGLTQSEYLAFLLYHQSYEDIEPATARYIRNVLYAAITTSQKAERLGMHTLDNPSKEEVENYEKWNKWITETAILDRVLGFVAEFIIMVLTWEVAFLTVGRFVRFGGSLLHAVRLSTLTARSGEGAANIEAIGRLMKIAARNSSTRVPLQVVRTGEAARASQVLEETVQAEVKKSIGKNLFTHNGITYFVPKGFRNVLVNVNGRWSVQVVEEGLSRAEIARRFAVVQDAVAEIMVVNGRAVGNAAKLLEELKSGLNYTAGAAGVNEGTVSVGVGARVSEGGLKSMPVPASAEATEGASTAATAANQGAQVAKQGKSFWKWLDETVIHWRPINSATPSFARQSWDSLNYWLRIQVPGFLKGVGQLGTSRYGVGAIGSGVSPMYAGTAAINNSTAIMAEAQATRSAVQVSEVAASAVGETSAAAATATTATTVPIANRSLFNILKVALNAGMKTVAPAVFAVSPWWAPENEQQTPLQVNIDNAYQQWMRKEEDHVTAQLRARLQQSVAQAAPMTVVVSADATQSTTEEEPVVVATQGTATQATAGNVATPITLSQQTSGIAAMDFTFGGISYLLRKASARRAAAKDASPDRHKFRDEGLASEGLLYTTDVMDEVAGRTVPVTFKFENEAAKQAFFKRVDLAEDEYFIFQPGTGAIIIRKQLTEGQKAEGVKAQDRGFDRIFFEGAEAMPVKLHKASILAPLFAAASNEVEVQALLSQHRKNLKEVLSSDFLERYPALKEYLNTEKEDVTKEISTLMESVPAMELAQDIVADLNGVLATPISVFKDDIGHIAQLIIGWAEGTFGTMGQAMTAALKAFAVSKGWMSNLPTSAGQFGPAWAPFIGAWTKIFGTLRVLDHGLTLGAVGHSTAAIGVGLGALGILPPMAAFAAMVAGITINGVAGAFLKQDNPLLAKQRSPDPISATATITDLNAWASVGGMFCYLFLPVVGWLVSKIFLGGNEASSLGIIASMFGVAATAPLVAKLLLAKSRIQNNPNKDANASVLKTVGTNLGIGFKTLSMIGLLTATAGAHFMGLGFNSGPGNFIKENIANPGLAQLVAFAAISLTVFAGRKLGAKAIKKGLIGDKGMAGLSSLIGVTMGGLSILPGLDFTTRCFLFAAAGLGFANWANVLQSIELNRPENADRKEVVSTMYILARTSGMLTGVMGGFGDLLQSSLGLTPATAALYALSMPLLAGTISLGINYKNITKELWPTFKRWIGLGKKTGTNEGRPAEGTGGNKGAVAGASTGVEQFPPDNGATGNLQDAAPVN